MTTTATTLFEFDQSDTEVLIVCHGCEGAWRAFAWTMEDAEERAAAHEARCHPGDDRLRHRLADRHARRRKSRN